MFTNRPDGYTNDIVTETVEKLLQSIITRLNNADWTIVGFDRYGYLLVTTIIITIITILIKRVRARSRRQYNILNVQVPTEPRPLSARVCFE